MLAGRFFGVRLQREVRALRDGREHVLFAVDQRGNVIAGDLKTVAVRDGVGGTRFDAIAAEDAARIVDVVNLRVALAPADAQRFGVFRGFDVDAIGWAGRGAQKTGHAFFES